MKTLSAIMFVVRCNVTLGNTEKPKDEENIGKQAYEAAKQDIIETVSKVSQEIKESGLYNQAAKLGNALHKFAHTYPCIASNVIAFSLLVSRKTALLIVPLLVMGAHADITHDKNKTHK